MRYRNLSRQIFFKSDRSKSKFSGNRSLSLLIWSVVHVNAIEVSQSEDLVVSTDVVGLFDRAP